MRYGSSSAAVYMATSALFTLATAMSALPPCVTGFQFSRTAAVKRCRCHVQCVSGVCSGVLRGQHRHRHPSAGKDERREAAVKNMYRLRALRLERDQKAKSN